MIPQILDSNYFIQNIEGITYPTGHSSKIYERNYEFFNKIFTYEENNQRIEIRFFKIEHSSQDSILTLGQQLQKEYKISLSNKISQKDIFHNLPFSIFTDNKGKYPCYFAQVIFPYRLADWANPKHELGIKDDYDYDEIKVTGVPFNKDKIKALTIINKIFESEIYTSIQKPPLLEYDDVTAFHYFYFEKQSLTPSKPILDCLIALDSKNAFTKSLEYFLSSTKKLNNIQQIKNETGLLNAVELAISEIKHLIENKNWTDPFWDNLSRSKKIKIQPKREVQIQSTLDVLLALYLSKSNIYVDKEVDLGIGKIDFKCSYFFNNTLMNVLVEFKLAHNAGLRSGIRKQLPAYLKANRSSCGIYIVMWFKDEKEEYFNKPHHNKSQFEEWLKKQANDINSNSEIIIKPHIIDASKKLSASNL